MPQEVKSERDGNEGEVDAEAGLERRLLRPNRCVDEDVADCSHTSPHVRVLTCHEEAEASVKFA